MKCSQGPLCSEEKSIDGHALSKTKYTGLDSKMTLQKMFQLVEELSKKVLLKRLVEKRKKL